MKKERENNFDLLRIIATIAVVMIHVSSTYIVAITNEESFGKLYLNGIMTSCIYFVISSFAVPCFVMLSGAFILSDDKNADFHYFYKKSFKKIGIPTLFFSLYYLLHSYFDVILDIIFKGKTLYTLIYPIKHLLMGVPFYHMWFMYMIIFVYLLVPIIFLLKNKISEKNFRIVSWVFIVFACISYWSSEYYFWWDIGSSFLYISYFLIGYELRTLFLNTKNNVKGIYLIIIGFLIETFTLILKYNQVTNGINDFSTRLNILAPFSPFIVVASICIFAGFSNLKIKKNFSKLSALSFWIYLFHAGYWDLLTRILFKIGYSWNNRIVIPLGIMLVLMLSILSAKIYLKIWNKIEKKWDITTKLCRLVNLS